MFGFAFKSTAQVTAVFFVTYMVLGIKAWAQTPQPEQLSASTVKPKLAGRNTVRIDLLAPVAASIESRLDGSGLVFPILVSYERYLAGKWSMSIEALIRGGTPDKHRNGASLMGRWYLRTSSTAAAAPTTGFYLAPVLSYRVLSTSAGAFDEPVNKGRRGGAGLLIGRQLSLGRREIPHLVFDVAVGVIAWRRLGPDRTSDPAYYAYINEPIFKRTGFLPDLRYGLGFQF
jgi:hypothetical protein